METKDLNEARIYVGTYAKYNNGSLQGEWVELSDFYDLDDFIEHCAEIHEDEEEPELMFQAWEEIPDGLIDEGHLEENFFELRDELDRLSDTEKEAFWIWVEGNNTQLTQDAYSLVKSFQSDYIGSWKSHSTLTLLATQDLPTFLYYMIDPLKSWCWGAILFYPFKNSRFS